MFLTPKELEALRLAHEAHEALVAVDAVGEQFRAALRAANADELHRRGGRRSATDLLPAVRAVDGRFPGLRHVLAAVASHMGGGQ